MMLNEEDLSVNSIYSSIDENLLIDLVKKRSVLWDSTEENYRKKVSCDAAWEEVCTGLFSSFELYDNERKTSLTKDVKRKWTNLRDCYNKSRKVGKDSVSKYKSLDFLAKVYDEKEKRGSSFVSPSKDTKNSTLVVDPDADTQVNSSLQSRRDRVGYSQTGNQATSDRTPFAEVFTVPRKPRGGVLHFRNVKDDSDSAKSDSDDEDAEDVKPYCSTTSIAEDVKPHCSTTSIGGESAQCNVRNGRKRRLEENKEEDGDIHYLEFLKIKLTNHFNSSQSKRFKSEVLQLLDSISNDFDDVEMEEFSIELLNVLLKKTNDIDIFKHIIDCAKQAKKVIDE